MRVEIDDPERGPVVMGGVPAVFTKTPGGVRMPAPTLGQHDDEVAPWPARPAPTGAPTPQPGPLAGYKVIDLGTVIAGTYGASLLAGLGADVTKVEPLTGDTFRYAAGFGTLNLGKRGLALDVRDPSGHDAFLDLVRHNDLVIDNYRPGVLQRLGIHYDDLVQVQPAVVTVSVTGFGEGGPLSYRPGFDPVLQAMSGMMRAQGGDDDPVFYAPAVNDVISAASTAFTAVAGLHHRLATGEGQRVWTSLTQSSALAQCGELVRYPGRPPALRGGRDFLGPGPLDRFYEAADGWIRLQATADDGRARLAAAGVLPEDGGPADDGALADAIAAAIAGMKQDEALDRLYEAGVPATRSGDLQALIEDDDLVALEAVITGRMGPRPHFHPFRLVRFSRTEVPTIAPVAPGLGEHSREVLLDHGFDEERVAALLDAGVISVGSPLDLSTYM
jgi:crotonobetainyl-CoA:carnitine CoA-transferase CaiB-like acyl-CoA transferase